MKDCQRTIKNSISLQGVGLHSGKLVRLEFCPALTNTGINFQRVDLPDQPFIKASPQMVLDTQLATRLGLSKDVFISTVEHLMAALFALGIDNVLIKVDSYELPILDGSSLPYLILLNEAGVLEQTAPKKYLVIDRAMEIVDPKNPTRFIRIEPSKTPMISYSIDFGNTNPIGHQTVTIDWDGRTVCEEISFARTFCLKHEIDMMRERGLALGGTLQNAVVVCTENGILNEQGLRSHNEFVLHKTLDCIGDLYLLGMPILGHVIAHKAGHDLHTRLALEISNQPEKCHVATVDAKQSLLSRSFLNFPLSLAELKQISEKSFASG